MRVSCVRIKIGTLFYMKLFAWILWTQGTSLHLLFFAHEIEAPLILIIRFEQLNTCRLLDWHNLMIIVIILLINIHSIAIIRKSIVDVINLFAYFHSVLYYFQFNILMSRKFLASRHSYAIIVASFIFGCRLSWGTITITVNSIIEWTQRLSIVPGSALGTVLELIVIKLVSSTSNVTSSNLVYLKSS